MGYKIYESYVYPETVRINGENANCTAEFVFRPSKKSADSRRLTVYAEFTIEQGVRLFRNEIRIIEESGHKVNYSVTDEDFKEMQNFAIHKDKIPSISTVLQEELYCVAITDAGIHPGINHDPTIEVKGATASCYGYFDLSDRSQLSMPMRYTKEEGFVLDTNDCSHIDVDMNYTLTEKEFEDNFKNKMYYRLFMYQAIRSGVESRLRYALTASESVKNLPEKVEVKNETKGPIKKEKGVNRYR